MRWRNAVVFLAVSFFSLQLYAETGVLVLAHGSKPSGLSSHAKECDGSSPTEWEDTVLDAVDAIKPNFNVPIEVAFGVWNTTCFQAGVNRLLERERGMDHLVVLPLFISDYSLVIEMQKFIFKQREKRPFASRIEQIEFDGKITYLSAINHNQIISDILMTRAESLRDLAYDELGISEDPSKLKLFLVTRGVRGRRYNYHWMALCHNYARDLRSLGFAKIDCVSLRGNGENESNQDLREAVDRAKQRFHKAVKKADSQGHATLVLPLLLAPGGIEDEFLKPLEGLEEGQDYLWSSETILPDQRLEKYLEKKIRPFDPIKPGTQNFTNQMPWLIFKF